MKKIYVFIVLAYCFVGLGRAQQDVQFTHNMYNNMGINPGYAGANDAICATILYRQQWVGFPGAPQTGQFSLDFPVPFIRGGIGINVLTDKLGYEGNTGLNLSYAYRGVTIGTGKLGIGGRVGFLNKGLTVDQFKATEVETFANGTDMLLDFGAGLYYEIPNLFWAGIATSQLSEAPGKNVPISLARHYYINAGYNWQLNNPNWEIKPSLMVKSDAASTQFDINAMVMYSKRFWGALNYRTQDAISLMIGLYPITSGFWKAVRVGYSYDFTTSELGAEGRSSGTHEIFLNYCFKIVIPKIPSSYRNPRFL